MIKVGRSSMNESFDSLESIQARLSKLKNSPRANMERDCLEKAIKLLGNSISITKAEAVLNSAKSECSKLAKLKADEYSKVRSGSRKLSSLVTKSGTGYDTKLFYLSLKYNLRGDDIDTRNAKEILSKLSEADQKACYAAADMIQEGDRNKNKLADDMLEIYSSKIAPMLAILGKAKYSDGNAPYGRFTATDSSETLLSLQKSAGLKGDGIANYASYS